jgi:hypothetical protein
MLFFTVRHSCDRTAYPNRLNQNSIRQPIAIGTLRSCWLPSIERRAIIPIMELEQSTDKLDARLEEEGAALAKLQSSLAENKAASEELKKSLDELEAATQKLADKDEAS